MRADGEDIPHSAPRTPHLNRQRRVAPRAAQNHCAIQHHPHNRVVHVPGDRSVVNEKYIRNTAQPLQPLEFIRANRLVTQITAGGNDGETEFGHQQVM